MYDIKSGHVYLSALFSASLLSCAQPTASNWTLQEALISVDSPQVKAQNMVIDTPAQQIFLPLIADADLHSLDPQWKLTPGVSISPKGPQDFTQGPVAYTIQLKSQSQQFKATAAVRNNPVIAGYYADPEILFSQQDQKYHLYPTSDGFDQWSGNYFESFSSRDLVHWHKDGKMLDLTKEVSWGKTNAWAPSAIEVKTGDSYRYYFYFVAAGKIGVATANSPSGPFTDSGHPLIDSKPAGVDRGQQIDPDVFTDPLTGKHYLYWGNAYLAVAELNTDMLSIKPDSIKILTPDSSFREGVEVFYRQGTYYFMWSENDTRDPNYRVRYATANSPLGPLQIPANNLVLAQDPSLGIYATGHNSVINKQGSDGWYIVYHRFTHPKGISMGDAAGYNREVCIDQLYFSEDGNIIPVKPTLTGIEPIL